MKTWFAIAVLGALTASAHAAPQSGKGDALGAPARVAVIRMQEAIKNTKDGKKAEETLRKEFEKEQKSLQAEGQKIQQAMEELRKQGMVMDEKSRAEKEAEIQKKVMQFEESKQRAQADFQKRDHDVSEPIISKVRKLVALISKEKGYTLVIDGGNVIYAQDQDDITDEVIKRYDSKK